MVTSYHNKVTSVSKEGVPAPFVAPYSPKAFGSEPAFGSDSARKIARGLLVQEYRLNQK
jgi:hypothetical protein